MEAVSTRTSIFIFGAGRSGTSLTAGLLARGGYFTGERHWPSRSANPKGFFEDVEVNAINEYLLSRAFPARPRNRWKRLIVPWRRFPSYSRWLVPFKPGHSLRCDAHIEQRMSRLLQNQPFCHKDPRFSFTLPAWRRILHRSTMCICVFRKPAEFLASVSKELREADYTKDLHLTNAQILDCWLCCYRNILKIFAGEHRDRVLLIEQSELVTSAGLARLAEFVGHEVDDSFMDTALHRNRAAAVTGVPAVDAMYERLCALRDRQVETGVYAINGW